MRTRRTGPGKGKKTGALRSAALLLACGGFCCSLIVFAALPVRGLQQESKPLPVNDYKIGAKDLLDITVFELPELNQTVRVSEDGSITLSMLGKVTVAGLSAQELEKKLGQLLEEKWLNTTAHVTVFIKEYQRVSVLGAVAKPGMYELVGPTNLLQILALAGGLTAEAMNELYVYRQPDGDDKTTLKINLSELIRGDQSLNVELQPKDVIMVPVDRVLTVFVYGEVKTPGALQFKSSKKITLLQAIAQAGGTTEWAARSKITINRQDPKTGKQIKIPVNLGDIMKGKTADIILEEGDVVIVPT